MKKIFGGDIKKIASSKFSKVRIDGKELKGAELKKLVGEIARGGKTVVSIGRALKEAGIEGSQAGKRSRILKVIEGDKGKAASQEEEKKEVIPEWRRARDVSGIKEERSYSVVARKLDAAEGSNAVGVGGSQSTVPANKNIKDPAKGLGLNAPGASVPASNLPKKSVLGIDAKPLPTKGDRPIGF